MAIIKPTTFKPIKVLDEINRKFYKEEYIYDLNKLGELLNLDTIEEVKRITKSLKDLPLTVIDALSKVESEEIGFILHLAMEDIFSKFIFRNYPEVKLLPKLVSARPNRSSLNVDLILDRLAKGTEYNFSTSDSHALTNLTRKDLQKTISRLKENGSDRLLVLDLLPAFISIYGPVLGITVTELFIYAAQTGQTHAEENS